MGNTSYVKMLPEQGWMTGFDNLFRQASGRFWRTRKWLVQVIFWLFFLNGMFAVALLQDPAASISARNTPIPANLTPMQALEYDPIGTSLMVFLAFMGLGLPIVAATSAQDAIIGERQSGTAAWVLSKPVSRPAFILSRLAAGAVGIVVTGVVIQGAAAYTQLSLLIGEPWPITGFLGAMGLMALTILFYLTLAFMLGSIFKSRGPVLGISLFLALVGPAILVKAVPYIGSLTPWNFIMDDRFGNLPLSLALMLGQPIPIAPVISTAFFCVIFTAVAILRFQREEF